MTLVGLCCCSYYSTYHISRQFERRQGAPNDEDAFYTTVFTNRIMARISEAWPRHRVMKDIVPSKYEDMKWILRDEKTYMRTCKKARRTK